MDNMIRVQVWDKDTFSPDDLVGEGQANIMGALNSPPGMPVTIPIDLYSQGKHAGRVNISISSGGVGMVIIGLYSKWVGDTCSQDTEEASSNRDVEVVSNQDTVDQAGDISE